MTVDKLLTGLFGELNERKITYSILRNYESLPENVENDIDIWVKDGEQKKFQQILIHTTKNMGWGILKYSPRFSYHGEGDYFLVKHEPRLKILHIDCWTFLYWRGISYINENTLNNHLHFHEKGFYISSPGVEASILLLKDLIYHKKVEDRYQKRIIDYSNKDSQSFLEAITKPFAKEVANFILNRANIGKWIELEKKANFLRWTVFKRAIIYKPFIQIKYFAIYLYGSVKKFFFPRFGLFIVFMGPDGSGKSTTARNIIDSELKKLFQKKIYFHGHFPFLPELKKIALLFRLKHPKKLPNCFEDTADYSKPFGYVRSMIYPLYYGSNYFLGHYLVWKERARGGLIIFDRYFYDYFIQKPFAKCPRSLLYLIARIIPNPDLTIYLKNNPEKIHHRKPELQEEEIQRQSKACQEMIKRLKNSVVIETSGSPDEVAEKTQKILVDKIKEKQKRKHFENSSCYTFI